MNQSILKTQKLTVDKIIKLNCTWRNVYLIKFNEIINKNIKPLHSSAPVFLFRAPSKKLPAFEDRADRRLLYFLTLSFPSVDSP